MPYNFSEEAELTNAQLAGELAKLTPLTQAEIDKLLPRKVDKKKFEELLNIVNSSAAQNKKVATLEKNVKSLGGVVIKLLGKYLKPV
ncbi:MAG TPA: hypothetical protein ENJ80_09720 [Gammaproteobacteria bacterium]|nr:hypothetical protein [Gammaproteobacteria bacterium]